jgi:hypothetical protein
VNIVKSNRNFYFLMHPSYLPPIKEERLVSESSADGERGASSYLWVGQYHHLDQKEVRELSKALNCWLKTGRLK